MEAIAVEQRGYAPTLPHQPHSTRWLEDVRHDAFARFEELGFPTSRLEAWRFTGIQPITSTPSGRVSAASDSVTSRRTVSSPAGVG